MKQTIAWISLFAAGPVLGCSSSPPPAKLTIDSGADSQADAGNDGASDASTSDASLSDVASSDAHVPVGPVAPLVGVRFAHWSADSAGVDVCLASHGSKTFRGPLLKGAVAEEGDAGEAGAMGLLFTQVTSYFYMPPDQYDARFVVAGAPDCSIGITPDATALPVLGKGGLETIALMGDLPGKGATSLTTEGFRDDAVVADEGLIAVRFIHAAPAVASADVGTGWISSTVRNGLGPTGLPSLFAPLFIGVSYGHASSVATAAGSLASGPNADLQGYALNSPLAGSATLIPSPTNEEVMVTTDTFGVRRTGTTSPLVQEWRANVAAGSVLTLVLLDLGSKAAQADAGTSPADGGVAGVISADGAVPDNVNSAVPGIQLLQCVDNAGTTGLLADCSVIAP